VFSKQEFKDLFKNYKLVQLYTDVVPDFYYAPEIRSKLAKDEDRQEADAKVNFDFVAKTFDTVELPQYIVLEPLPDNTIRIVSRYTAGRIRDEGEFAGFLKGPLEAQLSGARAELGDLH